jgi:2-oxo-3-hexenedioate decarboxylase/2-keto-4-pentenoate hydratase
MLVEQHDASQSFIPFAQGNAIKSVSDAYDVQDAYVARLIASHGNSVGYKIGLTSAAMQAFCGIDQPISGAVLAKRVFRSGATVKVPAYGRLGLEFEIAVRIATDPPPTSIPYVAATIVPYVDAVCAAIELVDDRAADYEQLEVLSLLADNSWNAGIVLAEFTSRRIDLAAAKGSVFRNGRLIDQGHGRDVLGHPMNSLAWLANHLASRGERLKAGQVVMTGSLVKTLFPTESEQYRFELEGIGSVELNVQV